MTDQQLKATAKTLVKSGRNPHEIIAALHEAETQDLQDQEAAKAHPLVGFSLPADFWTTFKAYMMDGGGVVDRTATGLSKSVAQALFDDDQATFWPALAHVVKSALKSDGIVSPNSGGGVTWNGVGPTKKGQ